MNEKYSYDIQFGIIIWIKTISVEKWKKVNDENNFKLNAFKNRK